jgi:C-terminal processing protease CtpA/Prc
MNSKCFSATDIFLAGLKGMNNITLLGSPSGGGSGGSESFKLGSTPIQLTLSSMASFQSNGKLFDGNGVDPDKLLYHVPEYFIGLHDNVLEEALKMISTGKK